MIIQIDETIGFEDTFDPADREEGFDDDIRFTILNPQPHRCACLGRT